MGALKIQSKNLFYHENSSYYLNFVFHIEVKTKSNHKFLNFAFQFIKNMKWHFGYTDFSLSKSVCGIINFQFCFDFIKVYFLIQKKIGFLTLKRHNYLQS